MAPKCLHVLITLAQWWYCFQRKSNSVQEDHQSATVPDLLLIMHWYVEAWDWLFSLYPQLWLWAEGLLLLCTWWISVLMFHHEHFFSRSIDASWWSHCTQGGLMPGICYTRSNFFIKGGEVTTLTITGDIFPPHDVKNTLIELNNQLPNFPHTPAHLLLTCSSLTLHDISLNLAHC